MNETIAPSVNGEPRSITTDPARTLLDVLREDLGLTGAKYGCGDGHCRACTVLMDGRPVTACTTPVSRAVGKEVVTIKGLEKGGELHLMQQSFVKESAMQCGYCVPGQILTAVALLENNPNASDDAIAEWMGGNICRCGGYPNILAAVRRARDENAVRPVS